MNIFNKAADNVTEGDLQWLIDNKISEQKIIEYKRDLPDGSDSSKAKFLSQVASFANASGGQIIFGMKEKNGIPIELCGLDNDDPDAEISRLESIILSGISPRIPGHQIASVSLSKGKFALFIDIPNSWSSPHMVTFKGGQKFYSRNSNGKYLLDVDELRSAFLFSEKTEDRIRNFRFDRLGKIVSGNTPIHMLKGPMTVLHMLPLSGFRTSVTYEMSALAGMTIDLKPLNAVSGWHNRHNYDGYVIFEEFQGKDKGNSYVQIFRNGCLEAVDFYILNIMRDEKKIGNYAFEEKVIEALGRYKDALRKMGVVPPIYIGLTMIGVKGYTLAFDTTYSSTRAGSAIDRDDLIIPEIRLDNYDIEPDIVLRPVFDMVWNAAGFPGSRNYDSNGRWTRPRY